VHSKIYSTRHYPGNGFIDARTLRSSPSKVHQTTCAGDASRVDCTSARCFHHLKLDYGLPGAKLTLARTLILSSFH
jgi:hypothetical protein